VEVVDELITKFRRQEWWSRLERLGTRVCDLILGPPFGRPRLEEAAGQLGEEQAARLEADVELEALRNYVA
jgi:hypothetical protein